jgi:1-acyl-sn-glycerol-3-phosphate acyltransferase
MNNVTADVRSARVPRRTWLQRAVYVFLRFLARMTSVVLVGMKVVGRHHFPRRGGVLLCSNHQSVLDPILIGLQCNRRLNYLARRSLFRNPWFSGLIRFLDAIPIEREGMGLEGLRETLRRLRGGEVVLIFPEGTRSPDGELQPLKPGFCAVAKRAEATIVPVALDGAHIAWPRHRSWPLPARIAVAFGPPILPQDIQRMTAEELVEELQRRLAECHRLARQLRCA